ncbi:tRNA (guanosine(46)-N7)-methyltransferase TrmB [Alteribacter natronophilus]|uniref:tRNA (guanosine(46)-N7)-methyltransferase TrmB n=1 Tax=Alteribacter natronophilus TaxID=2583810 RepID=UPI00110EF89E|nr:tRNA (guanosine(46)-N7)-methyltransferase TrmB [Alteribacter natronophilus]TMW71770.1 tRNA (guanosine(46)-N7)-methyltransferase TrmB [Alteribacter natronophilus]
MRQRNKPWAPEEIAAHPQYIVPEPSAHRGLWVEYFGNEKPLYVEVGSGKGRFVTGMAEQNPDVNMIGIEKFDSIILTGLERMKELDLPNVVMLKEDVNDINDIFTENEVDRFYINFTDPWPKNRHAKRRLTHEGFLQKYVELLKDGGEIHMKTDNRPLFEYSLQSFSEFGFTLQNISLDLHEDGLEGNVMTEYEEKFSRNGQPIYRLEAVWNDRSGR